MIKILIVHGSLTNNEISSGGWNKMLIWVGNTLSENKNEVTFCTLYDEELSPKILTRNNESLEIKYSSNFIIRNIKIFTIVLFKLFKLIKKEKYDYILSFGESSFFSLALLRFILNFRLVVSERTDPYSFNGFLDKLKRYLYKHCDIIVFQSKFAQNYFSHKIIKKSVVIPNPINIPEDYWNYQNSNNYICNVARLDIKQKRQDILIKAFSKVVKKYPDYKLNLYGDGKDLNILKELSKELNIENNIFFKGNVENVNKHLLENKIFVFSSDFEGMPNALLEAMAIGMPVITTDYSPGGASQLLNNNNNGILVEKNNVDKIYDSIIKYIENPKLMREKSSNARTHMKNYEENTIGKMWLDVFK